MNRNLDAAAQKIAKFITVPRLHDHEVVLQHIKRYLTCYSVDAGYELGSTTRYSGEPEAAIISTTNWRQGETIKKLTAIRSYIDASEYNDFKLDDFSVMYSQKKKQYFFFLGPARFVNHDCKPNTKFQPTGNLEIAIQATKEIRPGEEITTFYGDDYFGTKNCECLCATCERLGVNGWIERNRKLKMNLEEFEKAEKMELKRRQSGTRSKKSIGDKESKIEEHENTNEVALNEAREVEKNITVHENEESLLENGKRVINQDEPELNGSSKRSKTDIIQDDHNHNSKLKSDKKSKSKNDCALENHSVFANSQSKSTEISLKLDYLPSRTTRRVSAVISQAEQSSVQKSSNSSSSSKEIIKETVEKQKFWWYLTPPNLPTACSACGLERDLTDPRLLAIRHAPIDFLTTGDGKFLCRNCYRHFMVFDCIWPERDIRAVEMSKKKKLWGEVKKLPTSIPEPSDVVVNKLFFVYPNEKTLNWWWIGIIHPHDKPPKDVEVLENEYLIRVFPEGDFLSVPIDELRVFNENNETGQLFKQDPEFLKYEGLKFARHYLKTGKYMENKYNWNILYSSESDEEQIQSKKTKKKRKSSIKKMESVAIHPDNLNYGAILNIPTPIPDTEDILIGTVCFVFPDEPKLNWWWTGIVFDHRHPPAGVVPEPGKHMIRVFPSGDFIFCDTNELRIFDENGATFKFFHKEDVTFLNSIEVRQAMDFQKGVFKPSSRYNWKLEKLGDLGTGEFITVEEIRGEYIKKD